MKKFIGLTLTLIYLFTSSSLVHASTMGFFDISDNVNHSSTHCHQDTGSTTQKQSTKNMGCCELFSSNQYSEVKINFTDNIKLFQNSQGQVNPTYTLDTIPQIFYKHPIASSPGRQTSWGKYHKFSDLVGVIVKVI